MYDTAMFDLSSASVIRHTLQSKVLRYIATVLVLSFCCLALGCGSKQPSGSYRPPGSEKTQPGSPAKKGGTYKPYTVLGRPIIPLVQPKAMQKQGLRHGMVQIFMGRKQPTGNGMICTR